MLMGMTVKITVSLPDDVGEKLKGLPAGQVSAYVAEAVRHRQLVDYAQDLLTRSGFRTYPRDPVRSAAYIEALRVPDDVYEEAVARLQREGLLPAVWPPQ